MDELQLDLSSSLAVPSIELLNASGHQWRMDRLVFRKHRGRSPSTEAGTPRVHPCMDSGATSERATHEGTGTQHLWMQETANKQRPINETYQVTQLEHL